MNLKRRTNIFIYYYLYINKDGTMDYILKKKKKKKKKKTKRKVQGVQQSQTAAVPNHQEEEETDKSNQAQIEQTYEKH